MNNNQLSKNKLQHSKKNNLPKKSYISSLIIAGIAILILAWLVANLFADGLYPLAIAISAIIVFLAMTYFRSKFTPYQWLGIGIVLVILFTIYPIIYTFYLSVTNMGSGHLMSKNQAINRIEALQYTPEDGISYSWIGYKNDADEYAIWLQSKEGENYFAKPGEPIIDITSDNAVFGVIEDDGFPVTIDNYQKLALKDIVPIIKDLSTIEFGSPPQTIGIVSLSKAVESSQLYKYDKENDVIINQQTQEIYKAIEGTFTSESGEKITPGYIVFIGARNFTDFLQTKGFREPLGKMLIWNIAFTTFSVFISFGVGLVAALMFEDLKGRRIIRALLIIPWPIPVLVSVLIWRSMLHPDMGFIAPLLESIFGSSPAWFQDAFWTKFALILVNVWLSYPYFYVISAGAMRAIPQEIYAAALVDGANAWQSFKNITLPLILRILTPLIVASLTFNFNNFNVIYIFNYGNPPMANTIIPMGQTDILISFVYRLAFVTTNVTDYGLAAAITILLFLFITVLVVLQIKYGNMFKEVD